MSASSAAAKAGVLLARPLASAASLWSGATIFVSASLLFLVQPLISKLILPWFGGSAAVWITCILFFQCALLVGYLYAHLLARWLNPRMQALVHASLLILSSLALPIAPNPAWQPRPGEDPAWRVLAMLAGAIGLPYVLLSSTTPLLQSWYAVKKAGAIPYRYFALSNAGSVLALFTYPILIEPHWDGHIQALVWSGGYGVFSLLCLAAAWAALDGAPAARAESEAGVKTDISLICFWFALAAAASTLLLTVTNLLTQNIAPMPLLWVVPLGIYLLTFIFCFESQRWYKRVIFLPLLPLAVGYLAYHTETIETGEVRMVVPLICASLFICCMVCHGELSRLKPSHAGGLTSFYLVMAGGGATGGLFVALLAPHLFSDVLEYPISYLFCTLVVLTLMIRESPRWWNRLPWRVTWCLGVAFLAAVAYHAGHERSNSRDSDPYRARNFYGALIVEDFEENNFPVRMLSHGTIIHGLQIENAQMRHVATTYYGRESGVGLAWRLLEQKGPIRAGVVGLGAGTMAAYGRAGDLMRFYDLNSLVVDIARTKFSFLADCPAKLEVSLGDARLSLASEPSQQYDLLVIDAFAGDAIPVHLLTQEAFQIYWRHLKPDGILAVHVSNHYLDLVPIVAMNARSENKPFWKVENDQDDSHEVYGATYVLVSSRPGLAAEALMKDRLDKIDIPKELRPWTDNFTNLWQVLKWSE